MKTISDSAEKTRDDLRHHAVDAVAVAFTSRSLFNRITKLNQRRIEPMSDERIAAPPKWLHAALRARLADVVISHEPTRGIRDAFHKDTAMGLRNEGEKVFHLRKPLESMSEGELKLLVDLELRSAALAAYYNSGKDSKIAFSNGLAVGGTVARRGRISKRLPNAPMMAVPPVRPERYFEQGNNHHVEIFEDGTGKRTGRYLTTVDVIRRVRPATGRRRQPMIDTTPPALGWKFVMSLCVNDMVLDSEDPRQYFRLQKIEGTNNKLTFRQHLAAAVTDDSQRLIKSPNTLRAIKVEVDPIGRIREVEEGKA